MDQQGRLMDLAKLLQGGRYKLQTADREKRRVALTLKEMEPLPTDAKTYSPLGKAYAIRFFCLLSETHRYPYQLPTSEKINGNIMLLKTKANGSIK